MSEALQTLVAAMVERDTVLVLVPLTNGVGEVTKPPGWRTLIREIRRPAQAEAAYGHLEPVIVVEDDLDDPSRTPSLSVSLPMSAVIVDPWCGCSDPQHCRAASGVQL